jgi:tetratricopeptide (TPR) repeat protein
LDLKRAAAQGKLPDRPGKPVVTDVRVQKAQAAWDQYRYDEAIQLYERALARDPHHPVLLVDLARAYALRYRFAEAEKLVDLANSLHPDDARLQLMLGASYQLIQQFDRAIHCLNRALELEPNLPERPQVLVDLAAMHERLHNLTAARKCAEDAVTLAPAFYKAQYQLAHIDRRSGNLEAAEKCWKRRSTKKRRRWAFVPTRGISWAPCMTKTVALMTPSTP